MKNGKIKIASPWWSLTFVLLIRNVNNILTIRAWIFIRPLKFNINIIIMFDINNCRNGLIKTENFKFSVCITLTTFNFKCSFKMEIYYTQLGAYFLSVESCDLTFLPENVLFYTHRINTELFDLSLQGAGRCSLFRKLFVCSICFYNYILFH